VLQAVILPAFDRDSDFAKTILKAARDAHIAKAKGDDDGVSQSESLIDREAASYWQISQKELGRIQAFLNELNLSKGRNNLNEGLVG
jgi:hypothetical protein